nr:tyrosine-type recombinase/integrase [uncultured Desulfuromonas sp.]
MSEPLCKYQGIFRFPTFTKRLFENPKTTCSKQELADLLDVVGVQNSIQNLLHVFDNFSRLACFVPGICSDVKWIVIADRFEELQATADSILAIRSELSHRVQGLDLSLNKEINSAFYGLTEKNPLYVTLGYLPDSRQYLNHYDQFLAQLMVSICAISLNEQALDDASVSFLSLLQNVRALAKSSQIGQFPQHILSPEDYVSHLRALPPHPRIQIFSEFLAQGVSCLPTDSLDNIFSRLDDGVDLAGHHLLRRKMRRNVADQLDCREERQQPHNDQAPATNGQLYVFYGRSGSGYGREHSAYIGQRIAASRAMSNQLFEIAWDQLNQKDIQVLLHYLFKPVSSMQPVEEATKAELALMLFAGLSAKRLSDLQVSYYGDYSVGTDCYFVSTKRLRLVSPGPALLTEPGVETDAQRCLTQTYIDLELPEQLNALISRNLSNDLFVNTELLFKESDQINARITSTFSELRKKHHTRLTLTRVQNYLAGVLGRLPGGDIAAASLALGKEFYLSRTRIHYTAFDSSELQHLYGKSCQCILESGGYPYANEEGYPTEERYLGTPLRPNLEAVRNLVEQVKSELANGTKRFGDVDSFARYHNTYTLFTWLYLAYNTGYRAVNSPGIRSDLIDAVSGLSVIRDKDSVDHYHTRLVWLSEGCRAQLIHYRQHALQVLALGGKYKELKYDGLFFVDEKTSSIITATRSRIEDELHRFGFYLPANTQRHLLKSELQEDGCAPDIIELMLGHWSLGQEGWSATSALPPQDFADELCHYLQPLLRRIGFHPIAGLQNIAKKFCLTNRVDFSVARTTHLHRRLSAKDIQSLIVDPPAPVWFSCLGNMFQNLPVEKAFRPQQQMVLLRLQKFLPELYHGHEAAYVDEASIDFFIQKIKFKVGHPRLIYKRITFLIQGLEEGKKQLGWNVPVPTWPTIVPKPQNRVRQPIMARLPRFREVEEAFLRELEYDCPHDPVVQFGQVLLSAVLYGGLHHLRWVTPFVQALHEQWFYRCNDMLWLDLWVGARPVKQREQWLLQRDASNYRRWIADPLSHLLIRRLEDVCNGHEEPFDALFVYQSYEKHLFEVTGYKLPGLRELLTWANCWATLNQPAFLAAYLANEIESASLPDPVWMRLLTGHHYPSVTSSKNSSEFRSYQGEANDYFGQIALIKAVRKGIHERSTQSNAAIITWLNDFLQSHSKELYPASKLMCLWAMQMFSERKYEREGRQKKPEQPATVLRYLGCIGQHILQQSGALDFTSLDGEELQDLVEQWIEQSRYFCVDAEKMTPWGLRRMNYFVDRLNQFLAFAHLFHDAPFVAIHLDGIRGQVRQSPGVRANVMTVNEFVRLRDVLGFKSSKLGRIDRIALIWVILAFRTGLRISEIYGLSLGDLQGDEKYELLVQPNSYRQLKTESSCRRIPLYALLPEEELSFLREWQSFRLKELGATFKSPLFTAGPLALYPYRREPVLAMITPAIKQVTGDQGMVFHALRHSFANWMLVKLVVSDTCESKTLPHFLAANEFTSPQRETLKRNLLHNEPSGRKSLYLTAHLLGHADTETELVSYIHCCDWLCWQHFRRPSCMPPISAKAVAKIVGCSTPNGYKILQKEGHALAEYVAKNPSNHLSHPLEKNAIPVSKPNKVTKRILPVDFYDFLAEALPKIGSDISLPKKHSQVLLLKYWYHRLLEGQSKTSLRSAIRVLHDGYRTHYDAFIFDGFENAHKGLALLETLGARFRLRHYPYRHAEKSGRQKWSEKLGRNVLFGKTTSGRRSRNGQLRIQVVGFYFDTDEISYDSELRNLLKVLLALMLNL